MKACLKKGPDNIIVIPGFVFLIDYHLERGGSPEIGHPRSRGLKSFGRKWARGLGGS